MCWYVRLLIKNGVEINLKNILFISPTGTLDNGAEISISNLMMELKRKGYKILNIAPGNKEANRQYYDFFLNKEIETKFVSPIKWWWEDAPGTLFGTDEERANSYRETILEITKIINEFEIDLVISNTVNVYMGALAAACESIPHFWLIHEFPKNEFAYYKNKIDFVQNFSNEIFAVAGELSSELQQMMNKKIKSFVPYTKVEKTEIAKGNYSRIVSVGRINERKNQLELIKASLNFLDKGTELVLIGDWDDEYKAECDAYIKSNKIKNVIFTGYRENPWKEVTSRDICVFPSKNETFGLVYVEAILNGIPTIISNNLGHMSAYKIFKAGDFYNSGDIVQLKNKIQQTLTNQEELSRKLIAKKDDLHALYQPKTCYEDIIKTINTNNEYSPNSIRHIKNLLMYNTKRSKLAILEYRIRLFLSKANYRIKYMIRGVK